MPKVSIIIPVYNAERFLEKCLDSIENQTFKDIEIICVNDGSKDNSLKILKEYQKKDTRIVIIDKENAGVSAARNDGIRKSKGEYVTFADADDWLELDAIENMYNAIVEKNADVVRTNYYINETYDKVSGKGTLCGLENKIITTSQEDFIELVSNKFLNGNLLCYVWCLLVKRSVLNKTPLFQEGIPYMEDTIFYNELMNVVDKIYFFDKPTYHYYNNVSSCTKSKEFYVRNIYSWARAYEKIVEVIEKDKFKNEGRVEISTNTLGLKIMERFFFMFLSEKNSDEYWLNLISEIMKDQTIYKIVSKTNIKYLPIHLALPFKMIVKGKYKSLIRFYKIRRWLRNIKSKIKEVILKLKIFIAQLLYYIAYFFVRTKKYNILSDRETIDKIVEEGFSVARFGDGEFKWMLEIKQISFQKNDERLTRRLKEIITDDSKNVNILIGIPIAINTLKGYTWFAKKYWTKFFVDELKNITPFLNRDIYCNTNITRPYMDYRDKNPKKIKIKFENLKRIWDKRDVVIIEGEKTMLGVGNDLFDNCKSIQRIICPATNAFDKYDEIYKQALKLEKEKLILISLGPTATVLAYDLAKNGYQAIDTGHIDIEYMWFKNNSKKKESVKGKWVNEAKNNELIDLKDEKYEREIISRVI